MDLADTTSDARRVQLDAYRRMSPSERVMVALAMSEEARLIALAGRNRR